MSQHSHPETTGERFEKAVAIMARLRGPDGCPWDREQTFDTIKPYTVEETYEVLEAIDQRDWQELPAELGDLLLQVLFYAQMAKEQGTFSIDDVLDRLAQKLISRHPHVFGDAQAETSADVLRNWEALKAREKEGKNNAASTRGSKSILADVSPSMPALIEANKLSSRAARVGFDWPSVDGLLEKLGEEAAELKRELDQLPAAELKPVGRGIAGSGATRISEQHRQRLEDEVGDLLFVLVNIARHLSLDPESALKRTNRKFRRRFGQIEDESHHNGKKLEELSAAELEALWQRAKQRETSEAK